jgi:protein-S-isoprenylcysteine O-methyltransferase Ste14
MYTAALSISGGLAYLAQSLAFLSVLCIYLVLTVLLIPLEERGLQQAYGQQYVAYQKNTARLFPFVY